MKGLIKEDAQRQWTGRTGIPKDAKWPRGCPGELQSMFTAGCRSHSVYQKPKVWLGVLVDAPHYLEKQCYAWPKCSKVFHQPNVRRCQRADPLHQVMKSILECSSGTHMEVIMQLSISRKMMRRSFIGISSQGDR